MECEHRTPHKQNELCHEYLIEGCPQCIPYEEEPEDVEIYYSGQPDYLQEE